MRPPNFFFVFQDFPLCLPTTINRYVLTAVSQSYRNRMGTTTAVRIIHTFLVLRQQQAVVRTRSMEQVLTVEQVRAWSRASDRERHTYLQTSCDSHNLAALRKKSDPLHALTFRINHLLPSIVCRKYIWYEVTTTVYYLDAGVTFGSVRSPVTRSFAVGRSQKQICNCCARYTPRMKGLVMHHPRRYGDGKMYTIDPTVLLYSSINLRGTEVLWRRPTRILLGNI